MARSVRRTLLLSISELTGERVLSSPWVVRRSNRCVRVWFIVDVDLRNLFVELLLITV